ncbi:MAG: alpha/beta fold hydrolase [Myxococcota bacterium]
MRKLALVLLFGACMLALVRALEPAPTFAEEHGKLPELIPIEELFANAKETWNYKLSPDGKRLGWIGSYEGHPTIHFRKLGESRVHVVRSRRDIWDFWWVQDSRHIFFSWDEHGDENWHLLMVDADHPERPYVDLTPYPGRRARVHQVFPDDPHHILIKDNRRDVAVMDLYRMDLRSRETTLVFENPGDVQHWITDPDGRVLGRVRGSADRTWTVELRDPETKAWVRRFGGVFEDRFSVLGHPMDVTQAYAISNRGRDRAALVRVDLETGAEQVVYAHPEVDVDGAWLDRKTYRLRSAWSSPGTYHVRYFDETLERVMEGFRKDRVANVWVTGVSRDQRMWTVTVSSDVAGTSYHLYDSETDTRTLLAAADIARFQDRFAPMKPISFSARDGLQIHGYLTLPKGSSGKNLPLVLYVHGGPWWRYRWGFDHAVQFLANRGYAVLQPNFRGSTGYGRRFMEAAIGEFGGRMQEDLLDALAWAVEQGVADPARIAIYGWDYGGYTVLEALTATPNVFAAGAAASATADWVAALEKMPPYWGLHAARYYSYLGDPSDPKQRGVLRARSPIHRLDQIVRPLLVIQGTNDIRGMTEQAQAVVAALRARDAEVRLLELQGEGHWIQRWQSNVRLYRTLETFLAKHLGGRVSPVGAVELWLGLQ